MKSDRKLLYGISVSILAVLLIAFLVPVGSGRMLAAALLLPAAVLTHVLIKKRSILSLNRREVLMILSVIGLLYVMLYYLSGLRFGFYRSIYRLSGTVLWQYILPIGIIIISIEIIRSVIRAQQSKIADVLCYLFCVVAEVLVCSSISGIRTFNIFMDVVGMTLLPALISNLLYHYLARRYGAAPNAVYRLIVTLYPYVIPYESGISDSLVAFVRLVLPVVIFLFIDAMYEKKRRFALEKKSVGTYALSGIAVLVMISIVMLISCQFRFGALVIATESMTGEINKGDAVIFEEKRDSVVSVGDVIVFEKDGSRIVHRVVDITRVDGENQYYTKGDANNDWDAGFITDAHIVGIAHFKVPYVGYPTLWVRDMFDFLRGE